MIANLRLITSLQSRLRHLHKTDFLAGCLLGLSLYILPEPTQATTSYREVKALTVVSEPAPQLEAHVLQLPSTNVVEVSSPPQPQPLPPPPSLPPASPEVEISEAASLSGCPAPLLIALWKSETGPGYTFLEGEGWVSYFTNPTSGAQGPFQFMPGTWTIYADDNQSAWRVFDAAIVACRMLARLNLLVQPDKSAFIRRWTGADGGQIWSYSTKQAGKVWDQWHQQ